MATYIEMPKLSDTMTEGTLLKWRKKDGDQVEVGDILAEIETDKATMEMEAFDDGILHKTFIAEGEKVPIGSRIALLLAKGEQPPAKEEAAAPKAKPAAASQPDKPARTTGERTPQRIAPSESAQTEGRVRSSPLARKIAEEQGIDLAAISGSGPGGRIVARDVTQAKPTAQSPARSKTTAASTIPLPPLGPNDKRLPLSGMRRIIAERLVLSKTSIPHFYLHLEADAGPLLALRAQMNSVAEAGEGTKLTINDFVLKAVVTAAGKVPAVNASFADDAIVLFGSVNLAVAVAVEDGLVTPVIRDAQNKSIREISAAVKDLAQRARSKKLKSDEYQGGTITVSNLGSYGIESFDAIINPPQSIIISVGAIVKKPVVGANETLIVGHRMNIGLSADHRVVDGAIGAQYLAELRRFIENPPLMLF